MLRWLIVLASTLVALPVQADPNAFHAGQTRFVAGDYRGAYEAWLPAAEAGDPRAQYSLGVLYQRGQGVQRSLLAAAEWYALAAGQGYAPAETALRALAPDLGQPVFEGWRSPKGREASFTAGKGAGGATCSL